MWDDPRREKGHRRRVLGAAVLTVRAAPDQTGDAVERGTLRLHYLQKPIGQERYEIVRDGDGLRLTTDFDFTDRGGRVQLAATLRTRADYTPRSFQAKGKSYRFVNVDSDVTIDGREAHVRADGREARVPLPDTFLHGGRLRAVRRADAAAALLDAARQPRVVGTVPGLPVNDVFIEARGRTVVSVAGKRITLGRFVVDGVVWGRETIWLDERGAWPRRSPRRRPELRGRARRSRAGVPRARDGAPPTIASRISSGSRRSRRS
jgi:hypothetical protein